MLAATRYARVVLPPGIGGAGGAARRALKAPPVSDATEVATAPPPAPTLSRQVSRAMLWNAVLQPARLVAGLASGIILPNVLTKSAYGTIALLGAMAATLGLVLDLGVERALVKFLPEIEARYGREGVRRALWYAVWQKLANRCDARFPMRLAHHVVRHKAVLRRPFGPYTRDRGRRVH